MFSQSLELLNCVSLNAHLIQEAELAAAQRTIDKLRDELATRVAEVATLTACNHELTARLEAQGIPSEASEGTHNMLVGTMLKVTLGKSKDGRVQSAYKSQSALVGEILRRFPGLPGLSKSNCSTVIPDRVAYPNAASLGLPMHRVEPTPPSGRRGPCAATVMRALAIELFPHWAERLVEAGAQVPGQSFVADRRLSRRD